MNTSGTRSSQRKGVTRWLRAGLVSLSLLAAACSDDADTASTPESTTPETTADTTPDTTADTTPDTTPDTTAPETSPSAIFPELAPPTGEEMVIGFVNGEGIPGLDFPEMRENVEAAVDYLNQHGGMGGRPVRLETCTTKASPESSQACAQEMAGKNVELVMIGFDLFTDYPTYTAANIPVIGVLPIFPGDYTANALFLTGGNLTIVGAMAAIAKDHFGATSVAIVSADNIGANSTEAALTAALDIAGISHITVKGGDNETDAGYQGLMREAAKDNPDLLFSLYSDDGCIGTMRGRAALGITIPTITTGICSSTTVLNEVGDDAIGWSFVGVATREDTPELAILQTILSPALGVAPDEVDTAALGLGALSFIGYMSLTMYANAMQANGDAVTGESLYAFLSSAQGLKVWPNGGTIECGFSPAYPTVCVFTLPVAEYLAGGEVVTIEGLEAVSAKDYLP